jgi:outer membrane protein TolC
LDEVLTSVRLAFPLLYAVEQERGIAAGQRISAEGLFDTIVRAGGINQAGTFANTRLNLEVEQPSPFSGGSTFAGWRRGQGNFPVYYGDRKTADGGEFRAGFTLPLLRDGPIDRRRVILRQAQIAEQLADPIVRRARLDFLRAAAQAYWTWVAAGAEYHIAADLLRLARDRQTFIDVQRQEGLVAESVQVLNLRLIASREEALLAAERTVQQAAVQLSLFFRNEVGDPILPDSAWLPRQFLELMLPRPNPEYLRDDVELALRLRPELAEFRFRKEQIAADLALADNELYPAVNLFAAAAQDVGGARKTFTGQGPFMTDKTTAEMGLAFEVPVQRRDARGRIQSSRAQLAQLLARERYARDEIAAQVQDAVSELIQTYQRVDRAREELRLATRVRELETEAFRAGRTGLIELNLQEVAEAEARVKVAAILAAYLRAVAEYLAAIGADDDTGMGGKCVQQTPGQWDAVPKADNPPPRMDELP